MIQGQVQVQEEKDWGYMEKLPNKDKGEMAKFTPIHTPTSNSFGMKFHPTLGVNFSIFWPWTFSTLGMQLSPYLDAPLGFSWGPCGPFLLDSMGPQPFFLKAKRCWNSCLK